MFHATLANLFSRTNSRWFIDKFRYELVDLRTSNVIVPLGWKEQIRSGVHLEMYALLQQMSDSQKQQLECPWCFAMNTIVKNVSGMGAIVW